MSLAGLGGVFNPPPYKGMVLGRGPAPKIPPPPKPKFKQTVDLAAARWLVNDAVRALHQWRLGLPLSVLPLPILGLQHAYRDETTPIYTRLVDELLASEYRPGL